MIFSKKYIIAFISSIIILFISSCNYNNQNINLSNQDKIQQLEKHDMYVPWWKNNEVKGNERKN